MGRRYLGTSSSTSMCRWIWVIGGEIRGSRGARERSRRKEEGRHSIGKEIDASSVLTGIVGGELLCSAEPITSETIEQLAEANLRTQAQRGLFT